MSLEFSSSSFSDASRSMSTLLPVSKSLGMFTITMQPAVETKPPILEPPTPPKKPLSPYMTFSKEIWPRVKTLNKNATVCEIGAVIGRLWRELNEATKQRYNDAFIAEKQRYDVELQTYLRTTGLQASDLAKPRPKKKEPAKPVVIPVTRAVAVSDAAPGVTMVPSDCLPPFSLVWSRGPDGEINSMQLTQNGTNGSAEHAVTNPTSAESNAFLLAPFGSQQLQSYSLDTSSLSAETISQLRVVDGNGLAMGLRPTTSSFEQPSASAEDVESEVIQLRNALSERTLEAQRLAQELERASRIIEELQELCHEQVTAASIFA